MHSKQSISSRYSINKKPPKINHYYDVHIHGNNLYFTNILCYHKKEDHIFPISFITSFQLFEMSLPNI